MHPNSTFVLLISIILSALTPVADASFTHYKENSCQIIGDTDIYGIGVRVGFYLTFVAGVISLLFQRQKGIQESLKSLNIIYLAILVVMIRNVELGSFAMLEWWIITTMTIGLSSTILIPAVWIGGCSKAVLSWGSYFIIVACYLGLQPMVVFGKLLHQGRKKDCPSVKIYLLRTFDLYTDEYIRWLKVISVVLTLVAGLCYIIGLEFVAVGIRGQQPEAGGFIGKLSAKLFRKPPLGSSHEISISARLVSGVLVFIGGIFTVLITEKIISINQIDLSEVVFASTGQLIPFLTGLFTLLSTISPIIWTFVTRVKTSVMPPQQHETTEPLPNPRQDQWEANQYPPEYIHLHTAPMGLTGSITPPQSNSQVLNDLPGVAR